jgi:hypothetical protein
MPGLMFALSIAMRADRLVGLAARLRPRAALAIATEERIGQAVADFFRKSLSDIAAHD